MEEPRRQLVRTTLSREERKILWTLASAKGMTLTGYQDYILRKEIERASKDRRA